MTEIREIDGEVVIVTERGNEQYILSLPPSADEELIKRLLATAIRRDREDQLRASDYILMPDYPADEAMLATWCAYRQALRDIPEQEGFPYVVEWPVNPNEAQKEEIIESDELVDE